MMSEYYEFDSHLLPKRSSSEMVSHLKTKTRYRWSFIKLIKKIRDKPDRPSTIAAIEPANLVEINPALTQNSRHVTFHP